MLFPPLTFWVRGHVQGEKDAFPTPHVLGTRTCARKERCLSHPSCPGYEDMCEEGKMPFPPLMSWVRGHVRGEKDAFPTPHVLGTRTCARKERCLSHPSCPGYEDMCEERKMPFPPLMSWVRGHVRRRKDAFPTPHILGTRSCARRERCLSHPSCPGYEDMCEEGKMPFPPLMSWVRGHVRGEKDAFPTPHVLGTRTCARKERCLSHPSCPGYEDMCEEGKMPFPPLMSWVRGHVRGEKDAFPTPHVLGTRTCARKERCLSHPSCPGYEDMCEERKMPFPPLMSWVRGHVRGRKDAFPTPHILGTRSCARRERCLSHPSCPGYEDMCEERKMPFPPLMSWVRGHVRGEKDAFPTPHVLGTRTCARKERCLSHPSHSGYEVMCEERKMPFPALMSWVRGHRGRKSVIPSLHMS